MGWRTTLHELGEKIKRMNQIILAFPAWLVLGISGFFRRGSDGEGWRESEKNERYDRMY
ncbi:MAG: hypothetical protein ABEJ83_02520 [Candidatus Nanohaloarchaea archaeon]